ncbi:MAG: chorismate mutase [Thermodesulfobacteriota bacterium]
MDKETRSDLKKLKEKRRSIDLLDQKLLMLLNQRVHVALQIGRIKKRIGKKTYDPAREKEVLEKLKLKNRGPVKKQDLIRIFRTIMKVCRQAQT